MLNSWQDNHKLPPSRHLCVSWNQVLRATYMKQRWVVSSLYFCKNRNSYFIYKENLNRNRVLLTAPLSHSYGLAQQFCCSWEFSMSLACPLLKVITEESGQKFIGLSCTLILSRVSINQYQMGQIPGSKPSTKWKMGCQAPSPWQKPSLYLPLASLVLFFLIKLLFGGSWVVWESSHSVCHSWNKFSNLNPPDFSSSYLKIWN